MKKLFIYQTDRSDIKFMSYQYVMKKQGRIDPNDYNLVYSCPYDGETLNQIWEWFNIHIPDDYKARALSVGDIIVICDDECKAFYVNDIGFKELEDFYKEDMECDSDALYPDAIVLSEVVNDLINHRIRCLEKDRPPHWTEKKEELSELLEDLRIQTGQDVFCRKEEKR